MSSTDQKSMIYPYNPRTISTNLHAAPWDEFLGVDYTHSVHDQIDAIVQQVKQISKVDNLLFWQTEHIDFDKTGLDRLAPALTQAGYNVISVLDHSYSHNKYNHRYMDQSKIHYLPIVLASSYFQMCQKNISAVNDCWNSTAKKFLFLTGKPTKINRTRLLWLLSKAGLLDQAVWSYFMTPEMLSASHRFVPELDKEQFSLFAQQHQRNPDSINLVYSGPATCHYDGYIYDTTLYSSTRFRLIAETLCDTNAYLTEKTWIPVLNHVPFLMAASPGTLSYMRSMGFYTFEEYALEPYDHIIDTEMRFQSLIKTANHWMHIGLPNEVGEQVRHNHTLFKQIGAKYFEDLQTLLHTVGGTNIPLHQLIPLDNMVTHASWPSWYERIRDPAWPDCPNEQDFDKLPAWIQKECIEVFGYTPKEKT